MTDQNEASKKDCFIIMPISTPSNIVDQYHDGKDHFEHILNYLFIPAVEKAGFRAIPPNAKGSDLIHAEIIHKLEKCDLVMCDMSGLNPNVFFELGIRTSLNKPFCMVRDNITQQIPFDATIINWHQYNSNVALWNIEEEIERLASHISDSYTSSNNVNSLWKYFGVEINAKPYSGVPGNEDKLDVILYKLDRLCYQSSDPKINYQTNLFQRTVSDIEKEKKLNRSLENFLLRELGGDEIKRISIDGQKMVVILNRNIPQQRIDEIKEMLKKVRIEGISLVEILIQA